MSCLEKEQGYLKTESRSRVEVKGESEGRSGKEELEMKQRTGDNHVSKSSQRL